ncbi:(R)-mandelonitrile lyase 1-like [Humulus lupulus]|uniref:(R)-mandelonitrile lyase 1-like n=1 Tax=Humulus lupulus TaxID=3486 RepID=UPI002B40D510|nr:(R)-mandelonitrile lyase 1-like [Humulus lupulus]
MEPIAYILTLFLILFVYNFHHQLQVLALATSGSDHDFRYMESVYDATEMSSEEEYYDYIIIGGGTAGCPLAATLSQNYSVLVLERGSVPKSHPNVLHLSGFFANLMEEEGDDNGGVTPAQRFTSEDGVENVRGRVLGGTSMLNAGFFSRGDEGFFSQSGVKWEMDIVEKAYEWVEESIVFRPRLPVWQSAVKDGLLEAGVGPDNEFLLKHQLGTKASGSTFDEVGRRHGAVELLNKANLKNLRVAVRATVERIIFSTKESRNYQSGDDSDSSPQPNAIGAIYSDSNGKSHTVLIRHKGEVILSAGAIGTPQLLLLSGIGPHSYLSSLSIPIVHSQPNVGDFLADNPRNNVNLIIPSPTEPSSVQVVGITSHYFIETISANLPIAPTPPAFGLYPKSSTADLSMTIICEKLRQPLSSGSLWLASPTDVRVSPHVRFNYFAHPEDLSHCVTAMRKIGEVLKAKSLERFKMVDSEGERDFMYFGPSLPANQSDESAMEEFCRSTVTTIWHYHGGSAVGKVVNGNFQVMGVSSLRVVDGSTFRLSPGTNPQATVMMLGRYVGLKMLQEREAEANAEYY